MKKKFRFLMIAILVALDMGIKIVIENYFMNDYFIIGGIIGFKPHLNITQLSIFNNELALGVSTGTLILINAGCLLLIPLYFRRLAKDTEGIRSIRFSEDFLLAGAMCSLLDKIIWGGSLDYIYLLNRWIADLKDVYLLVAVCLFFIASVQIIRRDTEKKKLK